MTWREVDFESRLWTIPALRMKAEAEHSVPLTDRAMTLLNALKPKNLEAHRLVFPSQCGGKLSCWRTRSGIRPNAPIGAGGRWRSAVLSWMLGKPVAPGRLVSTRQRSLRSPLQCRWRRTQFLACEDRRFLPAATRPYTPQAIKPGENSALRE